MSTANFFRKRSVNPLINQPINPESEVIDLLTDSDRVSEEMIAKYADPVIRRVLIQRLRLYLGACRTSPVAPESEDLYQTIVLKLINSILTGDGNFLPKTPDEMKRYVAAIAHNVCNDALRIKYPGRHRIKTQIRDLFRRHPKLDSWKSDDQILCGFKSRPGRPGLNENCRNESWKITGLISELEEEQSMRVIAGFRRTYTDSSRLSTLVLEILRWSEGPVELDNLVFLVATVQGIKDQPAESIDDLVLPDRVSDSAQRRLEEALATAQILGGIWEDACRLPGDQRRVFILMSSDHLGESLVHRLLRSRIVRLSDLCDGLGLTADGLLEIWNDLPMNAAAIAGFMQTTPTMIAKWRHRAGSKMKSCRASRVNRQLKNTSK